MTSSSMAGVSHEDLQQYQATIQRLINCLSDPDRTTRRQALQSLQKKLIQGDQATPKPQPALLQALLSRPLLSPLVTLLGDDVEKCRSLSIQILTESIRLIPDVMPLLPSLIPAVAARVGRIPVVEPSEEVRLQLIELVLATIPRVTPTNLPTYLDDLVGALQRGLEDPFHDIKKTACAAISALCSAAPSSPATGQHIAPKLVPALLTNLGHQHSRVRFNCMQALDSVVLAGLPAGMLETTIAPAIRALATDRATNVREALFRALACWLGHPKDHQHAPPTTLPTTATYAPALLPILLLGITDPQESLAAATLSLLTSVGEVYLIQNPSLHRHPSPMQTDSPSPSSHAPSPTPADTPSPGFTYPKPFTTRPTQGTRLLISSQLPSLLPTTLRTLREWTVTLRSLAARCLTTTVLLAESDITPHLPQLLPSFCSAVADDDPQVASLIVSSVHVVGACVEPRLWLPLALEQACRGSKTSGQRASALVVLSGLLHAAGTARYPLSSPLLRDLADSLILDDVQGAAEHPAVRAQLLAVVVNILRACEQQPVAAADASTASPCAAVAEVSQQLLWVLLQLLGHDLQGDGTAAAAPSGPAASALQRLAECCGLQSAAQLTAQHAAALLPRVTADMAQWGASAPNYLVFRALLLTCDASVLARLMPAVAAVMKPVLEDSERDANLRLSMLRLLDSLLENPVTSPALGGDNARITLGDLLLPALVWRAGKTAAAVRFAAITTLATMLRKRLVPADVLAGLIDDGSLLPLLFQSLDEDWYVDVRNASCYVMEQLLGAVGSRLSHEQIRTVYIELTKRLDDSNNGVRVAACSALRALCASLTREYCDTNAGYLAQGVVVHMDDSDRAVQEAACGVLETLAAVKPGPTSQEVEKARERFRSKYFCDRVLTVCSNSQL